MKLTKILESIQARPIAYLLLGPPKSGKSSWAEKKVQRNPSIVNLNIEKFSDIEIRSDIFEDCLEKNLTFIYEGFALKDYRIEKLINKIQEKGYNITLVRFEKSLQEDKNIKKFKKKIDFIYDQFKDKFDNVIEVSDVSN